MSEDYLVVRIPRSWYKGTLSSFGSVAANKFVLFNTPSVATNFTLQGNNGAWVTIATDEYELAPQDGYMVQRAVNDSGTIVDWSAYASYRATYTVEASGTRTTYTNEAVTFADTDIGVGPIGPEGQLNAMFAKRLIATYLLAAGGNILVNDSTITLRGEASPATAYIVWKLATGETIASMSGNHAAAASSGLYVMGRAKTSSETGYVALQAYEYDGILNGVLALYSTGSLTVRGSDSVEAQVPVLYHRDFAGGTTVQGTTTETEIYAATINANQMKANGIVTIELGGDLTNDSGLTPNLTFRVKFGGTTILTMKVSNLSSFSGTGGYFLRARIANDGHTNVQRAFGLVVASKNGTWDGTSADYGTGAKATTSNQVVSVTAQWSTASGSPSAPGVYSKGGLVELSRTN